MTRLFYRSKHCRRLHLIAAQTGYVEMNKLTFAHLREVNIDRVSYFGHGDLENGWNEAEWGCAIAGEVGELCNILKKIIRRAEFDSTIDVLKDQAANELADVIIYADLIAAKLGVDLGAVVCEKFNVSSYKYDFPQRLVVEK